MNLLSPSNIIVALLALVYFWINRKLKYWKSQGVPYIEPEFYYGNSRGIGRDYHMGVLIKKIYNNLKSKGPVGGMYLYTTPLLIVFDLDLIKQMLIKDFHYFPNRGRYFNPVDDPISAQLVHLENEEWKRLRTKLTPAFTTGKIRMFFDIILQIGDEMIGTIDKEFNEVNGAIEVKGIFDRFTIDVIASIAFGIESNALKDKNSKFFEMGKKAMGPSSVLLRNFATTYRKLAHFLRVRLNHRDVIDFYLNTVQSTIQYREANPEVQRNDFMSLLLKLKDPSSAEPLTFHQIAAQCTVFLTAGYETTSCTLTYCLYELSQNETIQNKARESVMQALQKHDHVFSYDCVADMTYLEQCINETLRKTPPSFRLDRVAKYDYNIPNTDIVIRKGTQIYIPITGIHADPDIYPEPEIFDPDRFTPEEIRKRHPFAFIPFGEGARNCIAMRLAMVETKIALAKVLLKYKVALDRTQTSVPFKIQANKFQIMQPDEGIFIKFQVI